MPPKQHGAKASEVYGIVGYLLSIVAFLLWLIWAYTPEWILHGLSITYYPDRYWALAVPIFAGTLLVFLITFYNAWNMVKTYPFESIYTVRDSLTASLPPKYMDVQSDHQDSIPPAADIPITTINDILFGATSRPHRTD